MTVEGAIAIPMYLFITLIGADLCRVAYTSVALQFIAAKSLRMEIVPDLNGVRPTGQQRAAALRDAILARARGYGLNLADPNTSTISICRGYSTANCVGNAADAGDTRELLTVRIEHTVNTEVLKLLWLQTGFRLQGEVIGRNEADFIL